MTMGEAYTVRKNHKSSAFTIVELLIVIVVIGILAAIVIVAFNGVQQRAKDTSIRSELQQMAKKMELFKVDNGRYPESASELDALGLKLNKGNYQLDSGGSPRNNLYYITSNAAHPDGARQHYAVGTVPLGALTSTICMSDGEIIVGSCGGGDSTRALIKNLSAPGNALTETSWTSTGHSSTTGWESWTE